MQISANHRPVKCDTSNGVCMDYGQDSQIDQYCQHYYQVVWQTDHKVIIWSVCHSIIAVAAGWLPVHRDQLWAQRSVSSMGKPLTFTFTFLP